MSLTQDEIKKIAHLAKLDLPEADMILYTKQLSDIFDFVIQMDQVDTSHIDLTQRPIFAQHLRADVITESNQRELFQKIAPEVQSGLYIVPKVLEDV